jgi:hypothetical protein
MKTPLLILLFTLNYNAVFSNHMGNDKICVSLKTEDDDSKASKKLNNLLTVKTFPKIFAEKSTLKTADNASENFDYELMLSPISDKNTEPLVHIEL